MAECRNVTDSVLLTAVQWPKLLVISLNDDDVPVPGQSSLGPSYKVYCMYKVYLTGLRLSPAVPDY